MSKFRKKKSVPCPYCGKEIVLPKSIHDFEKWENPYRVLGEIKCPYCHKVGNIMPCANCAKIFVSIIPRHLDTIKCPYCNYIEIQMYVDSIEDASRLISDPERINRLLEAAIKTTEKGKKK